MDPAFNLYYPPIAGVQHINRNDATYVDIIHTDGGGYGTPKLTGTADYFANTGRRYQPGCPVGVFLIRSDNGKWFGIFFFWENSNKMSEDSRIGANSHIKTIRTWCLPKMSEFYQIYAVIVEQFVFGRKVFRRHLQHLLQQCSEIRLFQAKWVTSLWIRESLFFLSTQQRLLFDYCFVCTELILWRLLANSNFIFH